ncbi:MAG: acyltransferase, partial [Clostridiales Family XIII bacterium]|nr:acyltransferase [Clostridiales Family XIII bacterium]
RALGVLLVLVYHFFPAFLPGGFIGVDIFFVVSGYLITSLLIRESESGQRVDLLAFYRRRWRRLFPAICAMLLTCLPLSLLISPDFRVDVARQSAAALSWTTNYYEILTGQSYEAQLLPHLFIHTWTLSVEMQFYLIWGACVACIALIARQPFGRRAAVFVCAVAVFVASAALMARSAAAAEDPSAAYMSTPSHFFPLMAGSAFAAIGGFAPANVVKKMAKLRFFKPISLAAIIAGIIFMAWLSFEFSFEDRRVYAWGIATVSLIAGAVILLAGAWQGLTDRAEWKLTNYIGLRSYSIYLFHWPFMILAQHLVTAVGVSQQHAATVGAVCAIPATFAAAELSYRYVEQRFRVRGAWDAGRPEIRDAATRSARGSSAPQTRLPRLRGSVVAYFCAAVVLGVFSINAAVTAPFITSIEADLKYGAMTLDSMDINEAFDEGLLRTEDSPDTGLSDADPAGADPASARPKGASDV